MNTIDGGLKIFQSIQGYLIADRRTLKYLHLNNTSEDRESVISKFGTLNLNGHIPDIRFNEILTCFLLDYFIHFLTLRRLRSDTVNAHLSLCVEWLSHPSEVSLPQVPYLPEYFNIGFNYALSLRDGKLTGKPGWRYPHTKVDNGKYIHNGVKLTMIDRQNYHIWEGLAQKDLYDSKTRYENLNPGQPQNNEEIFYQDYQGVNDHSQLSELCLTYFPLLTVVKISKIIDIIW